MGSHDVGSLTFDFPDEWLIARFDEWTFYVNHFQKVAPGLKAVDLLGIEPGAQDSRSILWLIEVKDYRQHPRTKQIEVAEEIAGKAAWTLSALLPAALNANLEDERVAAGKALKCAAIRVVLHLEVPSTRSPVYNRRLDKANVLQKLKSRVKAIDAHPLVMDRTDCSRVSWQVR